MTTSTREEIRIGPLAIRFLVEGEESGGSVAVFEFDVPAGAKVPVAHSHDGFEETIYGLEGVLTWTIEGTPTDVGPGEALFIPRGAVHRFDNTHDVDAKALAIVTPGILGPGTSARSRPSSTPRPAARPTSPRWARSCRNTGSPPLGKEPAGQSRARLTVEPRRRVSRRHRLRVALIRPLGWKPLLGIVDADLSPSCRRRS